ncbi:MAG: hypothetical protein QW711_08235 [Candidatus Korarchaeum sp.]
MERLRDILANLTVDSRSGVLIVNKLISGKRVRYHNLITRVPREKRPLLNKLFEEGLLVREGSYVRAVKGLDRYSYRTLKLGRNKIRVPMLAGWLILEGDPPSTYVLLYHLTRQLVRGMKGVVIVTERRDELLPTVPFLRHTISGLELSILSRMPASERAIELGRVGRLDGTPVLPMSVFTVKENLVMVEWLDQEGKLHNRENRGSIPFLLLEDGVKCLIDGETSRADKIACPHAEAFSNCLFSCSHLSNCQSQCAYKEENGGKISIKVVIVENRPRKVSTVTQYFGGVYEVDVGDSRGVVYQTGLCLTCNSYSCEHAEAFKNWREGHG